MAAPPDLERRLRATLPDARLEPLALPLAPELWLWLLAADFPRGPLPPEIAEAVLARPAYWAFCWASGQALARHLLDRPEVVRGRTVLDFGAGSGVGAIAAARAGAARVIACDDDADALAACAANAALNDVKVELTPSLEQVPEVDLVLVADVLYDASNLPLLEGIRERFEHILLADSRVRPGLLPRWESIAVVDADTFPDLEESELYRRVRFYRPLDRARSGTPVAT